MAFFSPRKYTVIGSPEQRQRYKNDFNAEYSEYRGLHARIEGITRQFTVLDNELKQLQQGTDKYKVNSLKETHKMLFLLENILSKKYPILFYWFIMQYITLIHTPYSFLCLLLTDNPQSDT